MKKIILFFIFVFFISIVYAQPQFPIQVYGGLSKDIPDGTEISFKVGDLEIGSGTIDDNKYGYEPDLVFLEVDDVATSEKEGYAGGDSIDVYIEDVKVLEGMPVEGELINVDITISDSDYNAIVPEDDEDEIIRRIGTGGGCFERWNCTEWTSCINGKQTRDYVYVEDAVRANLKALMFKTNDVFNIGSGIETDVNKIFKLLNEKTDGKAKEEHGPTKPGEQRRSVISYEKAEKLLKWKPTVDLEEGLKRTVDYFRERA